MKLTTINIQGNIFTSEILEKIRQDDIRYQSPADFGLKPNELVRDEISNAWSLVNTYWQIFKQKRAQLSETDSGTSETRKHWILPLLAQLGYEIQSSTAEMVNEKSYAISHRASNKDGFPIHIVGSEQSLDKRVEHGVRLSPHALVQEYINGTDHIYGFVTNGLQFRVLRDATRLSRLSYLEFNLEQMIEEGHYAEFALFYRLLHASRINDKKEDGKDAILEFYHNEALASGSRIRERLSKAVEHSILHLANGLLKQPENERLRTQLEAENTSAKEYYTHILRSVYRILFLLVIEERNLIYKENLSEEERKLKNIYYQFYSIQRLTYLVNKAVYIDPKKTDLWQSLLTTFRLFEDPKFGKTLGVDALGSGIFDANAISSLHDTVLNNESVLNIFRYLVTFENENKQTVRVNYADLDVEEFGSVYEGLLEFEPVVEQHQFRFKQGDDRSSSGSHYTPEELVKPLITHSLDYIIADKLKEADPEKALLSITVCDVACGSGHILLAAARRIGFELAKLRSKEDQPTPSVLRVAIRDVIRHCIYGVDLNPLAVELCKVALWLEAHEPGEPLNFLDHHIKNGNAIVGLAHYEELNKGIASEAFKTLPGDDKEIATAFKKRNDLERKTAQAQLYDLSKVDHDLQGLQNEFSQFAQLPEQTPAQIVAKAKAYEQLTNGKKWFRLKQLADLQVAQFFIPKTVENKESLTTHAQYKTYLDAGTQILDRGASMAIGAEKKFYHWFLEFPEVFQKGGFDCILGNPPYLGNKKLSGYFGDNFLEYQKFKYVSGSVDLITYFLLRIFECLSKDGFLSLISTNTISQGGTREGGLDFIVNNNGKINFADKSIQWPGQAAVIVSLFSITKRKDWNLFIIKNKAVENISSYLDEDIANNIPFQLYNNQKTAFIGSTIEGKGFILDESYAIDDFEDEKEVVKRYLTGSDLLNNVHSTASRYVIDFGEMTEIEASNFNKSYEIVKEIVKPHRDTVKRDRNRIRWWIYAETRPGLYNSIINKGKVLARARISKTQAWEFVDTDQVLADALVVTKLNTFKEFSILQSSLHAEWAWKYCTTMKSDMNYGCTTVFETFPFPTSVFNLEGIGNEYHKSRLHFLHKLQFGLTKTYNLFHAKGIGSGIDEKDKQVQFLRKHLVKTEGTCSFEEAVAGITELRRLHVQMDQAVLEAFGWGDIALRHDFYEVDYLPENDRVRYTIHPDARKEVLKRLLELNHKIHAEEVAAGLWDKKGSAKKKVVTKKTITSSNHESSTFFDEPNLFNQ
ncbi:Eco57I restriction-modification methylase domain-containing protein [Soonwooa sp.]|uniref:Eco57I restriction-modification methylase domain-containing protein n=1 Tax=Soonwooa sp. TaxID=1938592 RepID=UPI00289AF8B3|nr:DNA methyltransferase [Soonwooa sp.]